MSKSTQLLDKNRSRILAGVSSALIVFLLMLFTAERDFVGAVYSNVFPARDSLGVAVAPLQATTPDKVGGQRLMVLVRYSARISTLLEVVDSTQPLESVEGQVLLDGLFVPRTPDTTGVPASIGAMTVLPNSTLGILLSSSSNSNKVQPGLFLLGSAGKRSLSEKNDLKVLSANELRSMRTTYALLLLAGIAIAATIPRFKIIFQESK